MQLFAQIDNQGTAMSITAVCGHHLRTHRTHVAVDYSDILGKDEGYRKVALNDATFHDCTGNDALSCTVCGATGDSPDLIGKSIARSEFNAYFGDDPNDRIEEPSTTLYFTDGTRHTFIHPVNN